MFTVGEIEGSTLLDGAVEGAAECKTLSAFVCPLLVDIPWFPTDGERDGAILLCTRWLYTGERDGV